MKRIFFACLILLALALPSQSWATAAACSGSICYVNSSSTGAGDGTFPASNLRGAGGLLGTLPIGQ